MGYPSLPYTFTNSTTADALQVNSNYVAIINGISDGTKDLNVSKITANGILVAAATLSASTAQISTVVASGLSANTGYLANGLISSGVVSGMSANSIYAANAIFENVSITSGIVSAMSVNSLFAANIVVTSFSQSNISAANVVTSALSANSAYLAYLNLGGNKYNVASGLYTVAGCTAAPTGTWEAFQLGNIVNFRINSVAGGNITCTSTSGINFLLTSIPDWANNINLSQAYFYKPFGFIDSVPLVGLLHPTATSNTVALYRLSGTVASFVSGQGMNYSDISFNY